MQEKLNKEPFFIVGCPRSGTTLLQLLINSHPKIAIPPESHIFVRFSKIFNCYGDLSKDCNLHLLVKDLLNDYHIRDWDLKISVADFCDQLQEKSLAGIISLIFSLYVRKEGKVRWGDKTPQNMLYLSEIRKVFPDAKFIHLIRDGRDVAVSSNRVFVGPPSIYGIAKEWCRYIFTFKEFKNTVDKSKYIEIHYEQLVKDPNNELKKIFEFLEESPISVGKNIPNSTAKTNYLNADLHMQSLNLPISSSKINIYKKVFTERKIEVFENIAKDALAYCGYSVNKENKNKIKLFEKFVFFIEDTLYRYYRKYFRPKELDKAWKLFRREAQDHLRTFKRSIRKR